MEKIEKVQGDAILNLFQELQEDDIPLTVSLTNGKCKRTHITDIRRFKKIPYFRIENQGDFQQPGDDFDVRRWRFEFIGRDKINYAFQTGAIEMSREIIWIRFPEIVQRYQRRSLFRLEAPHGTRLYFFFNNERYKLLVINVSLGGTLGVLVSLTKTMKQELTIHSPKILENVELIFPSSGDKHDDSKVNIKRCQIIRQERNPLTKKYECALEFKEIIEAERKKLTNLFYRWQREYLRKRRLFKL